MALRRSSPNNNTKRVFQIVHAVYYSSPIHFRPTYPAKYAHQVQCPLERLFSFSSLTLHTIPSCLHSPRRIFDLASLFLAITICRSLVLSRFLNSQADERERERRKREEREEHPLCCNYLPNLFSCRNLFARRSIPAVDSYVASLKNCRVVNDR